MKNADTDCYQSRRYNTLWLTCILATFAPIWIPLLLLILGVGSSGAIFNNSLFLDSYTVLQIIFLCALILPFAPRWLIKKDKMLYTLK